MLSLRIRVLGELSPPLLQRQVAPRLHFADGHRLAVEYREFHLVVVDREALIAETTASIAKATAGKDLRGLNEALEKVIELGMEGAEIDAAKTLRDELAAEEELTEQPTATRAKEELMQPP